MYQLHIFIIFLTLGNGAVGVIRIGWENQSTWSEPAPVPLNPPQVLHELMLLRGKASKQLTARAISQLTALPLIEGNVHAPIEVLQA